MKAKEEIVKLTPRIIEHILNNWGKTLCKTDGWNATDAKIYLFLTILLRDMRRIKYQESKEQTLCPICGDVTDGHPAMDKLCADIIDNAFTLEHCAKGDKK